MSEAGRSLSSNSAASVLGTLGSALLSMLYISLGARQLGPVEFGSVGALVALGNVLQLALGPLEAGLTLSVAKLLGQQRHAELRTFATGALRGLLVLAAPVALSWWLAAYWLSPAPAVYPLWGVQWLGVFCVGAMVCCLPRAVLRGREQFIGLSANFVIESGLRLVLGLTLIGLIGGASAMVAAYALAVAAAVAHGIVVMYQGLPVLRSPARGTARFDPSRADTLLEEVVRPFRSLTAPLLGIHAYAALMLNLDVLAAKHFLPARAAGLYAGATSISRIVAVGATPLLLVLFSRLATLSAAQRDTHTTLRQGALVMTTGLALSLIIPALAGELVLRSFLGEAYRGGAQVLLWQWAAACVVTLQTFFADAMLATSRVRASYLLLLPAAALLAGFCLWHQSALILAQVSLAVSATLGSATLYLLWRMRVATDPEGGNSGPLSL